MNCDLFHGNQVKDQIEAYLLGFIYADGTILFKSTNKNYFNTMKIDLAIQDEDYLLKINEYLNGKISYHSVFLNQKEFEQIRLAIYNVNLVNRLIKLGITHNKTYEECDYVFTNIPDALKWHFIRGFFDGDGCITLNNKGQGSFEIGCHNKTFITSLHDYMSRYITTNSNVTIGDGTWRIRYCGNRQIHQVYNFMYENALLKMDRKYRLIQAILPQVAKTSQYKHIKYQGHCKLPYSVWFTLDGKQKTFGRFATEHEALMFYNNECEKYGLPRQYEIINNKGLTTYAV